MEITQIDLTSEQAKSKYFSGIDLMKYICAILVVTIHTQPFGSINPILNFGVINYLARMAVPFYFVCSGYFLFRTAGIAATKRRDEVLKKYVFKIAGLYLLWTVVYLPPLLYSNFMKNGGGGGEIICTILFSGYHHLWYLLATVTAVISIWFLIKKGVSLNALIGLGALLYMIGLLAQSWFGLIRPLQNFPSVWYLLKALQSIIYTTRNGIFEGILFMAIGILFAYKKISMNFKLAVTGFIVSMGLMLAEVFFVTVVHFRRESDMYIFLVPAVCFLFYITAHLDVKNVELCKRMRKRSLLIYLIHSWLNNPVMDWVNAFMIRYLCVELNSAARFILVFGLSDMISNLILYLAEQRGNVWAKKLYGADF